MQPYYSDKQVTIYCGDCREVLPRLADHSVDAIVTDPPYNAGLAYRDYVDRQNERDYSEWLRSIWCLCDPLLSPDAGILWFWQGVRVANGEARDCLPDSWHIHHLAAWFKSEFAGDLWKGGHPAYSWEPIVWAVRDGAVPRYYGPRGGHAARDGLIGISSRHDVAAKGHPCPKTESVVRAVVQWVTPPKGIVLDPFVGAGTTIRAAKDLGHQAIGIELSEAYCEIAANRCRQEVMGLC